MRITRPKRPPPQLLGALVGGLTLLAACGDPHFDVFVRNDSSKAYVVVVDISERGLFERFMAHAHEKGGTLPGVGDFNGVITVLDAETCSLVAELRTTGNLIAVVIPQVGEVRLSSYDDAFPDPSHLPEAQLPNTDMCASSS